MDMIKAKKTVKVESPTPEPAPIKIKLDMPKPAEHKEINEAQKAE